MRRRAVLPFVLLLALVGAAPASAQTLYLQGSGQLEGARFHNFVVTGDGQQPRGWLSVSGAYTLHAVATCASVAPDAAVLGYRIDAGSNAGRGWLVSVQYGGSGTVVYAGTLPAPPATCPAPGSPAPPGFMSVGSGPVQNGSLIKSDAAPAGPTAVVDFVPPTGAFVGPGPFTAFAGLNGDDADKVTLALYPGGGPVPIFTTTAVHGADGLDAQADVPALPPGPYTATWTLTRHDGSTATASSAFTLLAPPRPIVPLRARVGCGRHGVHHDALGPHLRRPRALRRAPAPPSRAARRHARAARRRACARDGAPAERVVRAPAARSGPREHELGRAGAVQAALSRLREQPSTARLQGILNPSLQEA